MQDLYKKIRFLHLRKKIWKSWPYRLYIKIYDFFLKRIMSLNKGNLRIIFINGMKRSGNHFLMNSLMNSANASVIYYNNQRILTNLDIKHGVQVKFRPKKNMLLIVGYEDVLLDDFENACDFIIENNYATVKCTKLVIIRDLRNIMSSRLNHARMGVALRNKPQMVDTTKNLWANHHESLHGINSIRYGSLIDDIGKIDLKAFHIVDLKLSQKVLNRYGGGSSFENKNYNLRYKNYIGNEIYERLISDLKQLDEKIHGPWE